MLLEWRLLSLKLSGAVDPEQRLGYRVYLWEDVRMP